MEVAIEGGVLVVRIPLNEQGEASASGKSLVHATTRGNVQTALKVNGKPLTIGLNAYTK